MTEIRSGYKGVPYHVKKQNKKEENVFEDIKIGFVAYIMIGASFLFAMVIRFFDRLKKPRFNSKRQGKYAESWDK